MLRGGRYKSTHMKYVPLTSTILPECASTILPSVSTLGSLLLTATRAVVANNGENNNKSDFDMRKCSINRTVGEHGRSKSEAIDSPYLYHLSKILRVETNRFFSFGTLPQLLEYFHGLTQYKKRLERDWYKEIL